MLLGDLVLSCNHRAISRRSHDLCAPRQGKFANKARRKNPATGAGARPTDQTAMVQLQGMCIAYTCQMPKKSLVTPIWFSIEVLQSSYFLIVCFCHSVAPEVLPSGLLRWCNRGGRGVKSGGGSRSNFLRQISTLDFPYECHVVTPWILTYSPIPYPRFTVQLQQTTPIWIRKIKRNESDTRDLGLRCLIFTGRDYG